MCYPAYFSIMASAEQNLCKHLKLSMRQLKQICNNQHIISLETMDLLSDFMALLDEMGDKLMGVPREVWEAQQNISKEPTP